MPEAQDQRALDLAGGDHASRWQALGLGPVEVDDKRQLGPAADGPGAQQADAATFDEVGGMLGSLEEGHGAADVDPDAVIGIRLAPLVRSSSARLDLPRPDAP
jgi:hypothetical protein